MTILMDVWRFQCDVKPGDTNPTVFCFLRKKTTVDGVDFVVEDQTPVPMKFSDLTNGLTDLIDAQKIKSKSDEIKAAAIAANANMVAK